MNLDRVVHGLSRSVDPGAVLKQELEEAISPITSRLDELEKKLDLIISTFSRIEAGIKTVQPVVDFAKKLPFIK